MKESKGKREMKINSKRGIKENGGTTTRLKKNSQGKIMIFYNFTLLFLYSLLN